MSNENNPLFVHLTPTFCQLYTIQKDKVNTLLSFNFDKQKKNLQKETFDEYLKKEQIEIASYEDVIVSWAGKQATLLPNAIFEATNVKSYFDLNFDVLEELEDIDYNRVAESNLAVVYSIPSWIKKFFIHKNPKTNIQHVHAHQLRGWSRVFENSICIMSFQEDLFIYVIKNKELLLANRFDFQNEEDVLYYVSLIHQQYDMENKRFNLQLKAKIEDTFAVTKFKDLATHIPLFKSAEIIEESPVFDLNLQYCV